MNFTGPTSILFNSPLRSIIPLKGENITSCYITMKLPTRMDLPSGQEIEARPKEIMNFILLILEFMLSLLGYCIVCEHSVDEYVATSLSSANVS